MLGYARRDQPVFGLEDDNPVKREGRKRGYERCLMASSTANPRESTDSEMTDTVKKI